MKEVVVYFSQMGNTAEAARIIQQRRNADIIDLTTKRQKNGSFSFLGSSLRAITKKKETLVSFSPEDIKPYQRIYLGTPIWANNGTPAVNAFLEQCDLSGKEVIVFTMQADPEGDGADSVHLYLKDKIEKAGGNMLKALTFCGSDIKKPPALEKIRSQLAAADLD